MKLEEILKTAQPKQLIRRNSWSKTAHIFLNNDGFLVTNNSTWASGNTYLTKDNLLADDWYIMESKSVNDLNNGDVIVKGDKTYIYFNGKFYHDISINFDDGKFSVV